MTNFADGHGASADETGLRAGIYRIAGFDGIRALGAILVFMQHKMSDRYGLGVFGVRIFFVLSGYLIVGILYEQRREVEAQLTSVGRQLKRFWKRRIYRIFPIYYLTVGAATLLSATGVVAVTGLSSYWLLTCNLHIHQEALALGDYNWNRFTHLWTIAVEQQFYLASSVILLFAPSRAHIWILIGVCLLSIVGLLHEPAAVLPLQNFLYLAAGGLLYMKAGAVRTVSARQTAAVVGSLILMAVVDEYRNASTLLIPAVHLIVALCLIAHVRLHQASRITRMFEWRPLVYLGRISYGFYMYHVFSPDTQDLVRLLGTDDTFLVRRIANAVQFCITVALASVSWYVIERPLLRWGKRA